jgi:hypothetical protein
MSTNLPIEKSADSAEKTKIFFEEYGQRSVEFSATELDRVIGFFVARGFDEDAAITTGITLLRKSKIDGISVSFLLDSLSGFNEIQISRIVAEILNSDRKPISLLGFRIETPKTELLSRNIFP